MEVSSTKWGRNSHGIVEGLSGSLHGDPEEKLKMKPSGIFCGDFHVRVPLLEASLMGRSWSDGSFGHHECFKMLTK